MICASYLKNHPFLPSFPRAPLLRRKGGENLEISYHFVLPTSYFSYILFGNWILRIRYWKLFFLNLRIPSSPMLLIKMESNNPTGFVFLNFKPPLPSHNPAHSPP
jgi:hypothetical protein